ncbi:hypothetical protein [Hydrogenibacillus schlegelii]|uniref:Uncharacterized protein n=1 Tax=Hydrogenibacillus schlegelii TaxID=1484 RepID=A0A2T5GBU2_HYDSH|nr:hypothetical protein [Hydrogenibacillus schlegelii]PTQ53663.1 MAG: hypothetical protein HSCHL_1592 [Hydrogenibacillus schlegelii]
MIGVAPRRPTLSLRRREGRAGAFFAKPFNPIARILAPPPAERRGRA